MTTKGDKILDAPLAKIGGKGLFTKELEQDMLAGGIDIAVHSLKDMPTEVPEGLVISAITKRFDPGDAVVSPRYKTLRDLPQGAKVGTSSLRRKAQLLHVRPDLHIEDLRGNVNTRLRKLEEDHFDAIILAVAGLKRLASATASQKCCRRNWCFLPWGREPLPSRRGAMIKKCGSSLISSMMRRLCAALRQSGHSSRGSRRLPGAGWRVCDAAW